MDITRCDWVVIGSGFGGSVSALRLAEKGYRVAVLEKGRRFALEDLPRSNSEVRRWLWAPAVGAKGIFQMTFLKHVTILHGAGVGRVSHLGGPPPPPPAPPLPPPPAAAPALAPGGCLSPAFI